MRIAHFTAGTVGLGHLAHWVAVRRGLERAGFCGEHIVIAPRTHFPAADQEDYRIVHIVDEELTNPFTAPGSELAQALSEFRPDLLLVEMFWAPLMYLLPLESCEHWLLIRRCPPIWLTGSEGVPFDPKLYDRIIAFEPMEHPVFTDQLEPIVICNPDECLPPSALRNRVGVAEDDRLAVVAHAGNLGEIEEIKTNEGDQATIVRFDAHSPDAPFPLAEWLTGADAIYAAAGYNAFWESKWLGYYDRTQFTAFGRHIDDQEWRIEQCVNYTMKENGADQLARWIV